MTRIKMCGMRTLDDSRAGLLAGADMLGFIFYEPVRRFIEPALAAQIIAACREEFNGWQAVGVFVDQPLKQVNAVAARCGLDLVQLAGEEPPQYVAGLDVPAVKVLRAGPAGWSLPALLVAQAGYSVHSFLIDSHVDGFYGGTGLAGDWQSLAGLLNGCMLAGGLNPGNVAAAVSLTRASAVDVSSGIETAGVKDPRLMQAFAQAVRTGVTPVAAGR